MWRESEIYHLEPLEAVMRMVPGQMFRGKEKSEGSDVTGKCQVEKGKQRTVLSVH